jgi:hypothetical protein
MCILIHFYRQNSLNRLVAKIQGIYLLFTSLWMTFGLVTVSQTGLFKWQIFYRSLLWFCTVFGRVNIYLNVILPSTPTSPMQLPNKTFLHVSHFNHARSMSPPTYAIFLLLDLRTPQQCCQSLATEARHITIEILPKTHALASSIDSRGGCRLFPPEVLWCINLAVIIADITARD